MPVIGECGAGTDEHVILGHDAVPKIYSTLDGDAGAQSNRAFNESVVANVAVFSDHRTAHNVRKRPHAGPLSNRDTVVNESMGMVEKRTHIIIR
jgi:hypothetical protein